MNLEVAVGGERERMSRGDWRGRVHPVVLVALLAGALLSALAYAGLRTWERDRAVAGLATVASTVAASFEGCLHHQLTNLHIVAALYRSFSAEIGQEAFARLAGPLVDQCDNILALGWVPRVTAIERTAVEARAQRMDPGFRITQHGGAGRLIEATSRDVYFPVLYLEPVKAYWQTTGFDVASEPRQRQALTRAIQSGKAVFNHQPGDSVQLLGFYPVFVEGVPSGDAGFEQHDLLGVVTSVGRLGGFVDEALEAAGYPQIAVDLYEKTEGGRWTLVYTHSPSSNPDPPQRAPNDARDSPRATEREIEVADQAWRLSFTPAHGFFQLTPGWLPFGALGGGLALTVFGAGFLHKSIRHTERVESLVVFLEGEVSERRLAEQRFRTALTAVPLSVFNQDRQLRYTWAQNPQLFDGDPVIGRTDAEITERARDAERLTALKREVLATGVGAREHVRVLTRGSERFFDLTLEPLTNATGDIVGITGVMFDITEHLELQAKLRRQARQLSEADRRKDEFLAVLAHELRNPLAPIRNAAQVLKLEKKPTDPTVRWAADLIDRQVEHLARLVSDLLDVSRITRGQITLLTAPSDLSDVVGRALEAEQSVIESRGHELTVAFPSDRLIVDGDLVRLVQVFANLIDNAAKYTPCKGRIRVSAQREGSEAVIRISDSGVGISAKSLPHVFDMFVQINRQVDGIREEGLGLGLSLSKALVEMHGGRIEAASAGPGKGSEFTVRLPLSKAGPATDESAGEPAITESGYAMRVLVVEDNLDVAESFTRLLQEMGQQVCETHDGTEAIEAARSFHPDIVFLDIRMPGMDGYETARRLRAEHGEALKIVAVTGFGQDRDREWAFQAGFDTHLLKPVDQGMLIRVMHSLTGEPDSNRPDTGGGSSPPDAPPPRLA
jgi:signal transduction histidine kinase/CHASE1-domain containing sensor protein/ActR/RegA family two-component response regulator